MAGLKGIGGAMQAAALVSTKPPAAAPAELPFPEMRDEAAAADVAHRRKGTILEIVPPNRDRLAIDPNTMVKPLYEDL